ncbi:MAG TPA: type VI secretion system-associated FHA domain protein TagH [Caldimonas sp.]|nr:type VI secretion system-associated FHA domain protein TagH [Caldimonas sp.]
MPLTLRAVSLNDQPITKPIAAQFGAQGGSIGRADTNTLFLPDPERRISRRQADVLVSGSGYEIKNVGSANPIIVRDQSLALGESAPLRVGDQVRIGGYLLEVKADDAPSDDRTAVDAAGLADGDPFAATGGGPRASPGVRAGDLSARETAPAFPPSSPFADLGSPVSPGNPFAELLGDSAPRAPDPQRPSSAASAPSRLPDDFDPFAPPPVATSAAAPRPLLSSASGAFDDLIPSAAPASIDSMFGLGSSGSGDPLAAFLAGMPTPREPLGGSSASAPLSTDPLALFGAEGAARPPPPTETSPDQTAELRAAFTPPRPMPSLARPQPIPVATTPPPVAARPMPPAAPAPAARASAPPRPQVRQPHVPSASAGSGSAASPSLPSEETTEPPATGWSPDALAVWNALCEGAGVRLDPPPNTGPAFMRVVGMMLRSSVEGTVQLMAMRQATRQELQAQVTVIRPKNNNPLKFAPDGQSAMEQLLQPAVRGFLPGPAAMTDAMNDLLGHAIGTMAGTRAALEGVLKRFGPHELEAKLASKSVLDSVLPMNRKAKLWELYLQHYESIRDEAQEDFHTLFGRAFLAAYEQQLERLRREKSAAPK